MGPGVSRFLLYLPILLKDGVRGRCGIASAGFAKRNNHGDLRLVSGSMANEDTMRSRAVGGRRCSRFDSVHVNCMPRALRKGTKRGGKQEQEQDEAWPDSGW